MDVTAEDAPRAARVLLWQVGARDVDVGAERIDDCGTSPSTVVLIVYAPGPGVASSQSFSGGRTDVPKPNSGGASRVW